jgi:hypothetical protein
MVDFNRSNSAAGDLTRNDGQADPAPLAEILPAVLRRHGLLETQSDRDLQRNSALRRARGNPIVVAPASFVTMITVTS